MHKIDSPGATASNLFTEGNPALGVPATEVSDDWLNDVQEELVTVIEGQGITLAKGTQNQLQTAILSMIGEGGSNLKLADLLNNTANQDVTGVVVDEASFKGAVLFYQCHRQTDDSNVQESGMIFLNYDEADSLWRISGLEEMIDDAGLSFNVTGVGQLQVSTSNITGTNYSGVLRITGFMKFKN